MKFFATTALTSPLLIDAAIAQNLPTGGSVAAGSVSIAQPSATQLNITQLSQSAVVNWQGFSVGQGSSVNIALPNVSSAILNRVTGNTPSTIAGQINANGQVYLVNPNGIAITPSGTVNVGGGFVASTLGVSDADFMSGKRTFTGHGASAAVSNEGTIRVGRGGYAALIGGTVSNAGSIEVPLGNVGLGSGEQATLDFAGDGFLQVAMPTKAGGNDALIKHSGSIQANGGSVTISAATAREAARNAVNISGIVQARSIGGRNGAITIGGGAGGAVKISGKLNVASRKAKGGAVIVTGRDIALQGAKLNASGKTGGGSVRIGGDWQGKGELQRAETVVVDAASTIQADARDTGNGGTVVVWSDARTSFAGLISAKGGAQGGDGGNAEVSGKAVLDYTGFTDLSAAHGRFGTLLLDPYNVTISNGTDTLGAGPTFTANANDSIINVGTLQAALGGANVIISTGTGGAQAGDITVAAPLSWSTPTTLTLNAYHSIAINAPITIAGAGGLDLNTNQGGSGGELSFAGGVQYSGAPNIGQSLKINGDAYTLIYSMSELQGINNSDAQLQSNYALAKPLDASGVNDWVPIGTDGAGGVLDSNGFSGKFTGLGNTITDLAIDRPTAAYVGLFGYSSGTISDIGMIGGSVSGSESVGGLVGLNSGILARSYTESNVSGGDGAVGVGGLVGNNDGGTITGSHATGAVSGGQGAIWLGGLVGFNNGTVMQSYAEGNVTGGEDVGNVGGLVGTNSDIGTITLSHAKGNVSAGNRARNIGGLSGYSGGTVMQSYAEGNVTGGEGVGNIGGLVGTNSDIGTITLSHAKGNVSVGNGARDIGGLTGYSGGTITQSYAEGNVTGGEGANSVGGLVGTNSGTITGAEATGAVKGDISTGGLVGSNNGEIKQSKATGAVEGGTYVGGLVGENVGGSIAQSYATGDVTGGDGAVNIGGLAGYNGGTITQSYAEGNVGGGDAVQFVGGLVGWNDGMIAEGLAAGTVKGANTSGGLVGWNAGEIKQSKATGAVAGNIYVGGLVGENYGAITDSRAEGMVSGSGSSLGGLLGYNEATVTNSHAVGSVTGGVDSNNLGGLIGENAGGNVSLSSATGAVSGGGSNLGGLIGSNSGGTIAQSHATGAVGGGTYFVGGLVGLNTSAGKITDSYATGKVSASNAMFLGGLVGNNESGTITNSYATGDVSGAASSEQIGGLVGANYGAITQAYATGTVTGGNDARALGGLVGAQVSGSITQSFATGAVSGGNGAQQIGGLVGAKFGAITDAYATGAVSGGTNSRYLGGLVGVNISGNITRTYATGAVSGGTGVHDIGGLIGFRQAGTVTNGYWDTETSGRVVSPGGGTGLTTAQLQGALPTGFTSATWGTGGGLYPYLKSFFPTGVQAVSGFANKADGSAMASNANGAVYVSVVGNGTVAGSATTGANGYYYVFVPAGTLTNTAGIAAFTQSNAVTGAQDAVSYRAGTPNPLVNAGLDLTGSWRRDDAAALATLSVLNADYASTIGTTAPSLFSLANRQIATSGSFELDRGLSVAGMLWLSGSGSVMQSAALTTTTLLLTGTAGFELNNSANAIDNLAADAGSLDVSSTKALTIAAGVKNASGGTVSGITTSQPGGIHVGTTGNLTIASGAGVRGANPVLMAGLAFLNNQGNNAVTATSGRWLIYSANPTGNVFGNLDSGNTAIWNTAAGAAVSATGNRYVFAYQPTLTVSTSTNLTKTYGEDATAQVAAIPYTVTGIDPGVAGAYRADSMADILTGTASVTSAGAVATANVSGSPYAITATAGTLQAASGYALAFNSSAKLTVTPAALTITANDATKSYGEAVTLNGFSVTGLQNGETVGSVALASLGAAATANVAGSPYAITASAAKGGTFDAANYNISYVDGKLTVTPAVRPPDIGPALLASSMVRDGFYPIDLPENARPVFGASTLAATLGTGVFYADPRFDKIFVCFGGGGNTAQVCFAANP